MAVLVIPYLFGDSQALRGQLIVVAMEDAARGRKSRRRVVIQRCDVGCERPAVIGQAGMKAVALELAEMRVVDFAVGLRGRAELLSG